MTHKLLLFLGSVVFIIATVYGKAASIKCERRWRKIGCFHDRIIPDRPYPNELVNHRDPISFNWDGNLIDWKEYPQSLHALACVCANLTEAKGWKYFGLQFFGECWSGPTKKFYRDGPSKKCIGGNFKACDDSSDTECIGKAFTNYMYEIVESGTEEITDGGWSEWNPWTVCSAKCGGGSRSRERVCNNPEPSVGGKDCEGEAEEEQACNEEECVEVCEKKMEVGVILDSSTSVNRRNWNKTIDFVIAFSKPFEVSPTGLHFGVLHYGSRIYFDFAISDKRYWTRDAFETKLRSIRYRYGTTRTDLALKTAKERFFCDECGLRKDVPKLLMVLTDGKSNYGTESLKGLSDSLKAMDVDIISIGVGNKVDEEELHEIATDDSHVFLIDSYNYLQDKLNAMLKVSCKDASKKR